MIKKLPVAIFASANHPVYYELIKEGLGSYITLDFIQDYQSIKHNKYEAAYIVDLKQINLSQFIATQPNLQWIHTTMSGVDTILTPELAASPIKLTNSKGCYNESISEYALYSILHFSKKMTEHNLLKAKHQWERQTVYNAVGSNVSIVGYGSIGSTLAKMLKGALRCTVNGITKDPHMLTTEQRSYVDNIDSDLRNISNSQYVVGILPKTKDTVGYFNKEFFNKMNKTAVFINIGRGATLNENSLIEALTSKTIRGAALDVYPVEPIVPESKLWTFDNLLMSFHDMDHSGKMWQQSVAGFKTELINYLNRMPFKNIVNKEAGY